MAVMGLRRRRGRGTIASGEKITIRSAAAPGRAFPVTVSTFDPPRGLRFSGGMPLGLFRGVRTYTLSRSDGRSTQFQMREDTPDLSCR